MRSIALSVLSVENGGTRNQSETREGTNKMIWRTVVGLVGGWVWLNVSCLAFGDEPNGFTVKKTSEGVLVSENGQKVLFYQQQPKSQNGRYTRANYVHPLYSLDGQVLTEDFPADHRHHRGIFWAWHQLWLGDKKLGDAWSTQNFLARVKSVETSQEDAEQLTIHTQVDWTTSLVTDEKGQPVPLVREDTQITAHARQKDWRLVDFEIRLRALKPDVKIGGSEDRKGYGGFSVRVELKPETQFRDPNGPVKPQITAVKAGPWLDIANDRNGVAILDHPRNPGYPQPWILRQQRSMQNPAYPGREPVHLSQDKPLVLRYRLVIHDGRLDRETLDQLQTEWAKSRDEN